MYFKILILIVFVHSSLNAFSFDFEKYQEEKIPLGWRQIASGNGTSKWMVHKDQGNNVIAQMHNENPGNHFNILINREIEVKNLELSVKIRGIAGQKDQGGGLIWRYSNPQNYYVVRANPLENNIVLYKVENGIRTNLPPEGKELSYGMDVTTIGNGWHTLKVTVNNNLFTIFWDNNKLFSVHNDTFEDAGKVGLWTKADAVSYFDDFTINSYEHGKGDK